MLKILKYSLSDMMRSRWIYIYTLFYLLLTTALFWLSPDLSKVIISLMNIILVLSPLIAALFSTLYFQQSREFTELLLAQPVRRSSIFWGQYFGVALSMSLSLLTGLGVPFLFYGLLVSGEIWNFLVLLFAGIILSLIFSGLAYYIALKTENKIKGFSLTILLWLFFAVIYDGLFLLILVLFNDYPLDKFALGASLFNPINLARVLILLKLDISALMGYTGAVFQQFLGSAPGMSIAVASLLVWAALPVWGIRRVAMKKDF
ncbi:MAG: ABC transporter permease [Lewinellaceae bacterium]|nr:ABC transporter permease [Lewinellaceae bacterium]